MTDDPVDYSSFIDVTEPPCPICNQPMPSLIGLEEGDLYECQNPNCGWSRRIGM